MIISFANVKGGVGKTTSAINISVIFAWANMKTMLVDMDKQESSVFFGDNRLAIAEEEKLPNIDVVKLTEKSIEQIRNYKYDIIVIDVGGHNDVSLRKSIALSNLCIIPLQASALDIVTTKKMIGLIEEIKISKPDLKVRFLLTQLRPGVKANDEVEPLFEEAGIPFFKTRIYERVAYQYGIPTGRGAYESDDVKAKEEILSLYNEIVKALE